MDFGAERLYQVELWTNTGKLICDISHLCQNRQYTITRNDAEQFTFELDLNAFESYCTGIGVNPNDLIGPYKTDVKVKRNGQYLFLVQVTGLEFDCTSRDTGTNPEIGSYRLDPINTIGYTNMKESITVTCTGYLNIFQDRYITYTYNNYDPAHIAADLLYRTQNAAITPNGDVGVQVASNFGYLTGKTLTVFEMQNQQVKQTMQTLAELPESPFDFKIDADKNFTTYQMIGAQRNDIPLIYGGPNSTITSLTHQRTAAGALFNQVIALGSGNGSYSQLTAVGNNYTSQVDYFLRQKLQMLSYLRNQATLQTWVDGEVARLSSMLEMPTIVITGKQLENVPFISIGDRFPLQFPTHPFLSNINNQYFRVEQMTVKIDDNDWEYEVSLTMDNYGLNIQV